MSWTEIITKDSKKTKVLISLYQKRDLIFLLVKRDFAKEFKQTILGPLWFVIQPLFQTAVLVFVFGKIGKIGPTGIPMVSFYLAGTMMWGIFADNIVKTSETFRSNAAIFSKVYFPRLIMPVTNAFNSYLKLAVQFIIFLIVYFYEYAFIGGFEANWTICFVPIYFIIASFSGIGIGLILCALTTKYWDLRFMIQFAIQLFMFLSAVITPLYLIEPGWIKTVIQINPVTPLIESLRFAFLGKSGGVIDVFWLSYAFFFSVFVLTFGVMIFRKVERNFIDTV